MGITIDIKKALKGSKVKDRVLGSIEECMVHYLGVSVALRYGIETGSCIVHKLAEEAFNIP